MTVVPPLVVQVVEASALEVEKSMVATATAPKETFKARRFMVVVLRRSRA